MVERFLAQTHDRREVLKGALGGLVFATPLRHVPEFSEVQDVQTQQFLQSVRAEAPLHPEDIPDHAVIDMLGLNILSGIEYPEQTLADMRSLNAQSILYMGSDEKFLKAFRKSELKKRPSNRTKVITRYLSPRNSNRIEWDGFMHTVHIAKKFVKGVCQEKPLILYINEWNLYNSRRHNPNLASKDILTPQQSARECMKAAVFLVQNGCVPLLPTVAPHTGDELEKYRNFLKAVTSDYRYRFVKNNLQSAQHGYVTAEHDDPFMNLSAIDEMHQEILGQKLLIHYTEIGLSPDYANSLDPVERALAMRRLVRRPLPHSRIASLNLWALSTRPPSNPKSENYINQVLRIPGVGTTPMFGALQYALEERKSDVLRKQQYEMSQGTRS